MMSIQSEYSLFKQFENRKKSQLLCYRKQQDLSIKLQQGSRVDSALCVIYMIKDHKRTGKLTMVIRLRWDPSISPWNCRPRLTNWLQCFNALKSYFALHSTPQLPYIDTVRDQSKPMVYGGDRFWAAVHYDQPTLCVRNPFCVLSFPTAIRDAMKLALSNHADTPFELDWSFLHFWKLELKWSNF